MKNKKNIFLAIDDKIENLISLKALIKEVFPDATILTAQSGENGLKLAHENVPDIIILDIMMPEMDGFEVCKRLKSDTLLNEIPVIFLTALKGDKESRYKALESGAEAFLAKPIDEIELFVQLRGMLKIRECNIQKTTKINKLESNLKEDAERYRTLIESTDDFIWVVDPIDYGLLTFNSAVSKYFKESRNLTIKTGMTPKDLFIECDADIWYEMYNRAISEGAVKIEYQTVYNNIILLLSLYPLKVSDKLIGISIFGQDITVLKQNQEKLEISNKKLIKNFQDSINAISKIGELRDMYTAGHQKKVTELACAIAYEMGYSDDFVMNIALGAMIHDIGKIYISSGILNKPGKLSDLEYQILQTHPTYGYDVAREINFPIQIPLMILQHHEHVDGSGYPQGLTGDQILIESKILAVADVIEAITSHRPYRPALGIDVALEEISQFRGSKYDCDVVDASIRLIKDKDFKFEI